MRSKGRKRKARIREAFSCLRDLKDLPKPGKTETFAAYSLRLRSYFPGDGDSGAAMLRFLLSLGHDEPTQLAFMVRLEEQAEVLHRIRSHLGWTWKEEYPRDKP